MEQPTAQVNSIKAVYYSSERIAAIARICHETNRVYCTTLGDYSQTLWELAPQWQRDSAMNGVAFHLAHPEASDATSHENWMREKLANGWTFGLTKDQQAKTHPCLVPFEQLPVEQQRKDRLFRAIVHALKD